MATYEVHAKWTADSGHASNAEYVIQTPSGSDLVEVDQRSNGGSWQLLGSFTLEAGTGNSVILNADGLAIADAVRITRAVNLGDTAYIHSDHLGTPQKLTDASGSIVWDRVARPFGATHSESGSLATDLRFPGQLHDAESGLHYNTFRDYDPTLGRYIQSDPIGLNGGINTYGYAYQNSVRYIDPTGEFVPALATGLRAGYGAARACASNPACRRAVGTALAAIGTALSMDPNRTKQAAGALEVCVNNVVDDIRSIGNNILMSEEKSGEEPETDPLDDYPADPDDWTPPEDWEETSAGEKTGGRHRQWKDSEGKIRRRWDKAGDPTRQPDLGPHWWGDRFPNKHILPNR